MLRLIKARRVITNTVIILSPDHFSNSQKSIYFSNRIWDFPSGMQYFDRNKGSMITKNLTKNNDLVANDHGIFNIAADINSVWPKAKIVPILVGQDISFEQMSDLISNINKSCNLDCLLIASVDFSHYLPYQLADIHDEDSIKALTNMTLTDPNQIEVDSPQTIYALIQFAKNAKAKNFVLFDHTNSAKLVGSSDAESTSHVFGWYQKSLFMGPEKYQVNTFVLVNNLSKEDSLKSLGERFFYGVDSINLNDTKIPSDVVIAGAETPSETKMVYLPLKCVDKVCEFARGEDKNELLQNILKGVDNENGEITITKN